MSTGPYLTLSNASGAVTREITEERAAFFGARALEILAGPEPWDSDTLQELGNLAVAALGFDLDIFLEDS